MVAIPPPPPCRRPYSVILFDEVEKAHADVFNVLLQARRWVGLIVEWGRGPACMCIRAY